MADEFSQIVVTEVAEPSCGRNWFRVCSAPLKLTCQGFGAGLNCGDGRRATDQIVRQQVHPDFGSHAMRRLAAQVIHLERDLDAPQIELGRPAPPIELSDVISRVTGRTDQGGHDDQTLRAEAGPDSST